MNSSKFQRLIQTPDQVIGMKIFTELIMLLQETSCLIFEWVLKVRGFIIECCPCCIGWEYGGVDTDEYLSYYYIFLTLNKVNK